MVAAGAVLATCWVGVGAWALATSAEPGRMYEVDPLFAPTVAAAPQTPPPGLLEGDARAIALRVTRDVEQMWQRTFPQAGAEYRRTTVTFADTSECEGEDEDYIGYYCADDGIFLLLDRFDRLEEDFGDQDARRMWALVVAHEVGHHVQSLRGTLENAEWLSYTDPDNEDDVTLRLELQADCLAGVWAGAADIEAPDEFFSDDDTHGTADQQRKWFETGRDTLRPADCQSWAEGALR